MPPVDIADRLELMVDDYLIDELRETCLKLHAPQPMPLAASPFKGSYATVIKEGDLFRAWYRTVRPGYDGGHQDGHAGEITCYQESTDGIDWSKPELGLVELDGNRRNHAILDESPFSHNFSPFLDVRPGVEADQRYKALAGLPVSGGLHAFVSADGLRWRKAADGPVIVPRPVGNEHKGFDSQNVAFWSEYEGCYVACFRTWHTPHGPLRTISRASSSDFINWSLPQALHPNEPGEHLYTSQTHPYFRAPHLYIATPTRFSGGERGSSTDVLLMTARGNAPYARSFKEAWIRPGLAAERWGNRANYMALNIVPHSAEAMCIYHQGSGQRYMLRTDGFISVNAGYTTGELLTKPLIVKGRSLVINYSTAAAGTMQVEVQAADGTPLPGRALDDCAPFWGDAIEHEVAWRDGAELAPLDGQPVRLRFRMQEADLFALRFR